MPSTDTLESRPWYVEAFGPLYLRVYPHRDDAEAEAHAPLLCRLLEVVAPDRVLDVGCGAGRYARALARRGLRVTGLDLSPTLLAEARQRSPGTPGTPDYVHGDSRNLPFHRQFEAAISMFTSFGYFEDPEDDLRFLRGVRRALVPGGRLVLDYLNQAHVRANLVPQTEAQTGSLRLHMNRRIEESSPSGPCVLKHVCAVDARTGALSSEYEESVRLYTAEELDALLDEAGLEPVGERLGDLEGTPFDSASPRLVRVARRAP